MSPSPWLTAVRALGIAFLLLGALFIAWPGPASALFGIPADSDTALAYVRALGLRDVALGLYLLALSRLSIRGARAVLGPSALIPVGDLALVLAMSGLSAPLPLALHALSGLVLAGLTAVAPRPPD